MTSRTGYALAVLCLLAGVGIAGWFAWSAIGALQDALVRFVVPGRVDLTLDRPGAYTIFHEPDSVIDGKLYASPNIAGLRVTLNGADGQQIPVTQPGFTASYAVGGHRGISVLAFEIAAPGRYRLTATYSAGQAEPQTVLAVGHGFVGQLVGTIFAAIGAAFAGFAAALALVLTTYFRRRRLAGARGNG